MTIDKAIELLTIHRDDLEIPLEPDLDDAITLSIHALLRIQTQQKLIPTHHTDRLPGETKE